MSAKKETPKVKVGDTFYLVFNPRYVRASPRNAKVLSVGRKWITVEGDQRFDLHTLISEHPSRYCIYPSKEVYEKENERLRAWDALRKALEGKYTAPAHLTAEQITSFTKALLNV